MTPRILFLDQSGKPGGAELCLADIAQPYGQTCLVGLFADGSFKTLLEQQHTPVQVLLNQPIQVRKESSLLQGLSSLGQLLPLIAKVAQISRAYDLIYANTQKALVIGALASAISRRPLVYHLHDILSDQHFSRVNRRVAVSLANQFAARVIANSKASQSAFLESGGRADKTAVVYNGFDPARYQIPASDRHQLRQSLGLDDRFVVGHFSRLSPWKGQHVLIEALTQCPESVTALLVGDALFGEQAYAEQLHQQVTRLGLTDRVRFLGFRSDVPQLMSACDLVAHTSTAAEPFGRVIVEAMLCGTPVVAAAAGGAIELVEPEKTGWLTAPGNSLELATIINQSCHQPEKTAVIAQTAQTEASQRFHLSTINREIANLLHQIKF